MKNYELVLLLDASLQEKERKEFVADFEKQIKDSIVEKDEIWLKTTVYDLGRKNGNNKFYFVSYQLKLTDEGIAAIKKSLLYTKVVARYFLFLMTEKEEFLPFETIQKNLEKIINGWAEKKMGQKITFFSKPENEKYVTWKALPMLKKYMTRFGNIKPRRYTANPVSIQKKVRQSIIRAREMWLVEYIK